MWVKFDDNMPDDPEVDRLSDGAFRLYVAGVCYAQRQLTDGLVHTAKVQRLVPRFQKRYLDELTRYPDEPDRDPLWSPQTDGFQIRNFAKWNKSRSYWEDQTAKAAERKIRWRDRREQDA